MSFEYLAEPGRPAWTGLLPGRPEPYFLRRGEGEHAKLFTDTFSVLLSGDETEGQFGMFTATGPAGDLIPTHSHADTHETFYVLEGLVRVFVQLADGQKVSRLLGEGDFGYVPAGFAHAYRIEQAARMLGTATGGFERYFQHTGTATDTDDPATPPYVPDFPRMRAASAAHHTEYLRDAEWPEA